MRNINTQDHVKKWRRLILVIPLMAFIVLPFLILVSSSFKTEGELNLLRPSIIPNKIVLSNFEKLLEDDNFLLSIKNSFLIAVLTMIFTLVVSTPAAYIIARVKGRIASLTQIWIVVSKMIPIITLTVPLYLILKSLRLTDSFTGLTFVYITWQIPITLWLLKGFMYSFPIELEDAARIDGCSTLQMIIKIIFPNILPGIVTAGIFAFIGAWNEFFFNLIFMRSPENIMISTKLWNFLGLAGQSRDGELAAASLISCIPGIILFSVFQRYYVSGLTKGAVK